MQRLNLIDVTHATEKDDIDELMLKGADNKLDSPRAPKGAELECIPKTKLILLSKYIISADRYPLPFESLVTRPDGHFIHG